jgi:phytoene dehydrogenase-like protein
MKQVGGRVRTDHLNGFLLDRGFQVLLTDYLETNAFSTTLHWICSRFMRAPWCIPTTAFTVLPTLGGIPLTPCAPWVDEAIIILNGGDDGPVNHVCIPSAVASSYALAGAALISVTVLDEQPAPDAQLERGVRSQMTRWFGDGVGQ